MYDLRRDNGVAREGKNGTMEFLPAIFHERIEDLWGLSEEVVNVLRRMTRPRERGTVDENYRA